MQIALVSRAMRATYLLLIVVSCSSSEPTAGRSAYSCFSYQFLDNPTKRFDCYRRDECPAKAKKAETMAKDYANHFGGPVAVHDVSDCVPAQHVWCFHTRDKGDDCSPTSDACDRARVEAKRHDVDSDCTQR
jgi:hypothetical protein